MAVPSRAKTTQVSSTRAKGRVANPTAFGQLLYTCIGRQGLSANEFAQRVEMSSGFISGVYSGNKRPPLDRIPDWAAALKLRGSERNRFVLRAHLEHASPTLRKTFDQLRKAVLGEGGKGLDLEALRLLD